MIGSMPRPARFAWFVLAYNVAVILWGAYVRATGSGAGCGEHWPLCNGQVIPRAPELATLIEFSHRLTSGVALVAVAALMAWTFRSTHPGHPDRGPAVLSVVFIVTEAAVGAGLVLFQLVADNATMARAMFMAVHLLNTFFLLGALTVTAWTLTTARPLAFARHRSSLAAAAAGCAALLAAGASGSIAALGDTLFPSATLTEALWADLSAGSHLLIRLRMWHPVLAVAAGILAAVLASRLGRSRGPASVDLSRSVTVLVALQIGLGFLNVMLLAPVWLQLLHLLTADALWIAFVIVCAEALAETTTPAVAVEAA
jgi:cytochrome c oxidase assembly protein subunit 15